MHKEDKIKVIIVDDEFHACNVLEKLIADYSSNFEIKSIFHNLLDAVEYLKITQVDVVFLDIQMPVLPGYRISDFFDKFPFEIVFVTAYNKYAIKAFEMSAIDYILKPVSKSRLHQTLKKIEASSYNKQALIQLKMLKQNFESENKVLIIPELNDTKVLNLKDIICFEGQGSYSKIYLENGNSFLISKNLKTITDMLPSDHGFFRSQKSWLINLKYVSAYNFHKNYILLNDTIQAKISKLLVEDFKLLLSRDS